MNVRPYLLHVACFALLTPALACSDDGGAGGEPGGQDKADVVAADTAVGLDVLVDAGSAGEDVGSGGKDAGSSGEDAGSAGTDAGAAGTDAGSAGTDAGPQTPATPVVEVQDKAGKWTCVIVKNAPAKDAKSAFSWRLNEGLWKGGKEAYD